ncbi:MAG TPA: hypothetical protein VG826_03665 [Pirellulales bacterium]|nr:hypothetical protein [Pirellulales bacterium]
MRTIIRNTADLNQDDRTLLERLLGEQLHDDQQLVIGVVDRQSRREPLEETNLSTDDVPALPDWCNVYEGLSDEEIADLERVILQRADLSRPS